MPTVVDQLSPLFDLHSNLVGWIVPERHVFDRAMSWIAYLSEGDAWSVATGNWLGPVRGLACFDRDGRVVASTPDQPLELGTRPRPPVRSAPVPPRLGRRGRRPLPGRRWRRPRPVGGRSCGCRTGRPSEIAIPPAPLTAVVGWDWG